MQDTPKDQPTEPKQASQSQHPTGNPSQDPLGKEYLEAVTSENAVRDIVGWAEDMGIKLTKLQVEALCVKISYWFTVGFAKGAHTFSELYTKKVRELAEQKTKDLMSRAEFKKGGVIFPFNSIIKP